MFIRGTSRSSSSYSLILLTGSWLYLSYSLLALLVNGAAVATNTGTVSDCAPNISEPHVPMYRLGGVPNLSRECEQALTPLLHDCHLQYFSQVRDAFVAAKCYGGGESFRRVACCRLWEAKECFVRAASARVECEEGNTTDHYRSLPIDPAEREHLLDRCSEYQEGVAACEPDENLHASFSFGTFVTILLVFISLPAVAFGIMKAREFYLDYKKFHQEEAERNIVRLDAMDGGGKNGSISLPLTEKGNYHDDHNDDDDDDDIDHENGGAEELPKKELPMD